MTLLICCEHTVLKIEHDQGASMWHSCTLPEIFGEDEKSAGYPRRPPEAFEVIRPAWSGMMFQRILSSFGLRRAWGGGYGVWLQDSAGGG